MFALYVFFLFLLLLLLLEKGEGTAFCCCSSVSSGRAVRKGHFIITFIDLFIAFFYFRYGGVWVGGWRGGGGTAVLLLQFCGLCLSCDGIKWRGRERCFFCFTTFMCSFFSFIGERE